MMRADERLEDHLARLAREREDADRQYNDALSAVDAALLRTPDQPHAPPPYDDSQLYAINHAWDILPNGAPPGNRSIAGRLRSLIWRLVGPPFERQKHFNAALIDHLNRNTAAHREAQRAIASLIDLCGAQAQSLVHFQAHLIRYLQSITLFVDTRDRASAGQIQTVNAALSALSSDWMKRWEALAIRDGRSADRNAALTKAYDDVREVVAIAQQTNLTITRELERLRTASGARASDAGDSPDRSETHEPPARSDASVDNAGSSGPAAGSDLLYVGFEDRFRGSRDTIRARLTDYPPRFAGATNVLDIGCGRGELLDLFREHGVPARGIDTNAEMVEACRARGLAADRADAVAFLAAQPDQSLGGVIAIQVVEHFPPAYLLRFIDTVGPKLKPGALLVLETLNPACWTAFFESYIRDISHAWPLHPETLRYLVQAAGFTSVDIEYREPVPEADKLPRVLLPPSSTGAGPDATLVELVDAVNAHADKLNGRLFTHMDYALVARR